MNIHFPPKNMDFRKLPCSNFRVDKFSHACTNWSSAQKCVKICTKWGIQSFWERKPKRKNPNFQHNLLSIRNGLSWIRSDLVGFWFLVGLGRIWSDLVGFGRIWLDLVGFGRIWSDFYHWSIRSDSVRFGRGQNLVGVASGSGPFTVWFWFVFFLVFGTL